MFLCAVMPGGKERATTLSIQARVVVFKGTKNVLIFDVVR